MTIWMCEIILKLSTTYIYIYLSLYCFQEAKINHYMETK